MRDGERLLAVMRHAKAEDFDRPDNERELAPRGVDDARATGRWCASEGLVPDGALISAAERTRETWRELSGAAQWSSAPGWEPHFSQALYTAGPETALDLIRETPEQTQALWVIGHNPTMSFLAAILDDGSQDTPKQLTTGFPTCAVALFAFAGSWADLAQGSCRLVGFHAPG